MSRLFPNLDDFNNNKVQILFLHEVPIDVVFRYQKNFYKKINIKEAVAIKPKNDPWFDFVEISPQNRNDAVMIGAVIPKTKKKKTKSKKFKPSKMYKKLNPVFDVPSLHEDIYLGGTGEIF